MPKFRIHFADGQTIDKEKNTADEAKTAAKNERRQDLPRDTPASAAEVKVTRIERLE